MNDNARILAAHADSTHRFSKQPLPGIDLLGLPRGTRLNLGESTVVEVTGLRNPCAQIENFQPGLLKELVGYDDDRALVRRAGIMGFVRQSGTVRPGEGIAVELPEGPFETLERV
ncbi:hypothetical protein [Arthrobacter alpinus]|uniref:hypothetical protein n=2 Tax=Arthrobacter alpinus TaxID=656366 RepID=UPI0016497606|nr:hypothetical protein [Arthrobacter alpinus]